MTPLTWCLRLCLLQVRRTECGPSTRSICYCVGSKRALPTHCPESKRTSSVLLAFLSTPTCLPAAKQAGSRAHSRLLALLPSRCRSNPGVDAGSACVAPLVDAAVALFATAAESADAREPPPWNAHPLSRLLLVQPAVAAPLLEALPQLLCGPAPRPDPDCGADSAARARVLRRTLPFLSYVFLEPDLAGTRKLLGQTH